MLYIAILIFLFNIFLQIVSRLVQIRDYITKASSMREDLVEKNERSANVERLTHLIEHLKEQEKSYMKFLQKILVSFRL
jgi:pericentriolar material 1 protein